MNNILGKFKIFSQFSQDTLNKLTAYIEDSDYMPNQTIFSQNIYKEDEVSIYFLNKG